MVTPLHGTRGFVDKLINSLKKAIATLKANPSMKTEGAVSYSIWHPNGIILPTSEDKFFS